MSDVGKALVVEVKQVISIEQTIDLCVFFEAMSERARADYCAMDPEDEVFAGEGEYWWPMAYLWPGEDAGGASGDHHGKGVTRDWVDVDDCDIRVRERPGRPLYEGGRADWTEDDFQRLRDAVPWLDAFHREREGTPDDPDLIHSRIPGPLDAPMF